MGRGMMHLLWPGLPTAAPQLPPANRTSPHPMPADLLYGEFMASLETDPSWCCAFESGLAAGGLDKMVLEVRACWLLRAGLACPPQERSTAARRRPVRQPRAWPLHPHTPAVPPVPPPPGGAVSRHANELFAQRRQLHRRFGRGRGGGRVPRGRPVHGGAAARAGPVRPPSSALPRDEQLTAAMTHCLPICP